MSPSLDQDNSNNNQSSKSQAKGSSAQTTKKAGRRNNGTAKKNDDNGVLSAVMKKHVLKAPEPKQSALSSRFSPPESSPEREPKPLDHADVIDGVTSPLLDAISAGEAPKPTSQNTTEWLSKNIMSGSPNSNLINLGESPPTFSSSYEGRYASHGWNSRDQRGIPSSLPTPASPQASRPRSTSYHNLDGNFETQEDTRSQMSYVNRRRSMASPPYSQFSSNPPLPHQIQPHFYGLPDADFMHQASRPKSGSPTSDYYSGFDENSGTSVAITGYEGGVDIYAITKRGLIRTTRISGLRGGVYNAKILSGNGLGGSLHRPAMIAVVVHGPVRPSSDTSSADCVSAHTEVMPIPSQTESIRGSPRARAASALDFDNPGDYYQTTVEVYSMDTRDYIVTLLSLPKLPLIQSALSSFARNPPPAGSLSIRADASNIAVSSGTSGETWLFCHGSPTNAASLQPRFRCIGKVWTTVQNNGTDKTELASHIDGDWNPAETSPQRSNANAPILSLNGRWLAYCPSTPSSQLSVRAAVPNATSTARSPGLNGQAPPQLPPVNCEVDTPGRESKIKQAAQAITQGVVEGANYIGKAGVQYWNNYWSKPATGQASNGGFQFSPHANIPSHQFPPTHGVPSQAPLVSKDPGLISILDLDNLAQHASYSGAPHPLATFKVPHGCSFVSFSPNGLALFSVSTNGDLQFVWDLMRIQYSKASFLKSGPQPSGRSGVHVRQIAAFSRMTVARVVDVVWTSPHGERAAYVTERGTVHVLDLEASAFAWPPPRRKVAMTKSAAESPSAALTAAGAATSAVKSAWSLARPLVSRERRSSTGKTSVSMASPNSQTGTGTQAFAAGFSRSVGAATGRMNELRKSSDTKLHLPRNTSLPSRTCIRLLHGRRNDSMLVLGGGLVGRYTIKSRRADRPANNQKSSKGAKYVEFKLPHLPDISLIADQLGDNDLHGREGTAYHATAKQAVAQGDRPLGAKSSIPQAEIESNAPYQPFHTDRRVTLNVYSYAPNTASSPSASALLSNPTTKLSPPTRQNRAWAFGGSIKTIELDVGTPQDMEDTSYDPLDHRALPSSAIERVRTDPDQDTEQIVVTTRIRKSARPELENGADEEGFFEDDCDVLDFSDSRV
ncbi:hypothetical protein BJ878DRAFT_94038 [Calycina marina]|uniref:WD40 repeat-like protein n=1 Tax=Calycina marina TaxID=1763456 RepID=A0A9P7ZA98_9HELO|nr:hypothetical protein BJ878DRAFT_94038 [Calycina marina]